MAAPPLAAWLDSYRLDLRAALECAAAQGFRHVHADTARGVLRPAELSGTGRRHLRRFLADLGLVLDGLALDHPGAGLADPARAEQRVAELRQMLALCTDLGVRRASVSLSGLDAERTAPLARELLALVADEADRHGVATAVFDPAGAPGLRAAELRRLGCPQLQVGLDTAAPGVTAEELPQYVPLVGAVHLRDVRRRAGQVEEVAFGAGEVDFAALLAQLQAGAPEAALVLRRDTPAGVDALRQGRDYIRSLVGR